MLRLDGYQRLIRSSVDLYWRLFLMEHDVTTGISSGAVTFGELLRQLRRRAGLTQGDLAALVGFSVAQISRLEKDERLPQSEMIVEKFIPVLLLEDEPRLAQHLVTLAAEARGERPPLLVTQQQVRTEIYEEAIDTSSDLPGLPLPLVGRDRDIDLICKRLMASPGRLLTLIGPPGVGKTQLALAVATKVEPFFADGAHFIALAAVVDAAHVPSAIATALQIKEHERKAPRQRLIETLRRKTTLLVLDNFEQVNAAAPFVAELLSSCAGLSVLVTSQEPLRLRVEQRQRIEPLEPAAAVELFLQRAEAIHPDFGTDPKTVAAITAIVLRLDCLPLAIELVAPQLELFSPQQLLTRLADQPLDLLNSGPQDLPAHQRTLRAAIERSYALLSSGEQRLLQVLSLFTGGALLAALTTVMAALDRELPSGSHSEEHIVETTVPNLRTLVRKSLVQQQGKPQEQRYQLLTTIREYVLEQLVRNSDVDMAQRAYANYFRALVEQQRQLEERETAEKPQRAKAKWETLEMEQDNLRGVLQWALAHDPIFALGMVDALGDFWETRGHDYEARHWIAQALEANPTQTENRAAALVLAANFARRQADYTLSQRYIGEAETIYKAQNNQGALAYTLRQAGWLAYDLHDKDATQKAFQQSLALYRTLADPAGIADLLLCLVHLYKGQPKHQTELEHYLAESLSIYQQLARRDGLVQVLQQQGEVEISNGNYALAQNKFTEALALWRAVGDKLQIGWALAQTGEAAWLQRDIGVAGSAFQEAYQLFETLGNVDGMAILRHHLAQVSRQRGDLAQAEADYGQSLQLSYQLENQHMLARGFAGLGGVALAAGEMEKAAILFGTAQAHFDPLPPFLTPGDSKDYTEMVHAVTIALGEQRFREQWQIGYNQSLDEQLRFAGVPSVAYD